MSTTNTTKEGKVNRMKNQNNADLRKAMKERKVPVWKIADALGCHENTVLRMFRHEIAGEEKERIMQIILNSK